MRSALRGIAPLLLALALGLAAVAGPAGAQERTPTPSAQDLWQAYPLHATPEPENSATAPTGGAARTPPGGSPARTAAGSADRVAQDGGGIPPAAVVLALLSALAAAAGALLWLRRRRWAPRMPTLALPGGPRIRVAGPLFTSPHATQVTLTNAQERPPRDRTGAHRRARTARHSAPAPAPPDERTAALPPDPDVAWSAEIDWRETDGAGAFHVVARTQDGRLGVVGKSGPLEWPPRSSSAVQALTAAADRLENDLLAAGWSEREPGGAWYARRFAWEPAPKPPATAPQPVSAPAPVVPASPRPREPARRSGRFQRSAEWAKGSETRWRCEITWSAGYKTSRFQATVFPPGGKPGNPIGSSEPFKWLLMADPDPANEAHKREVRRLGTALRAAGWAPARRGAAWYAARYMWRGEGAPPDRLELAPPEQGHAR